MSGKNTVRKAAVLLLLGGMFFGISAGVFSQDPQEELLKKLILQKFDINHDGTLVGLEKDGAVIFLQKSDKDKDSNISEQERSAAITALKKLPNPSRPDNDKKMNEKAGLVGKTSTVKGTGIGTVKKDYYSNNTIIAVAGFHTVVPKNSILYVPPIHSKLIVEQPKGELLHWPQFRDKYKGYIRTLEVTPEMAKGEERLKSKDKSSFYDDRKIVVAVLNNSPISVIKK